MTGERDWRCDDDGENVDELLKKCGLFHNERRGGKGGKVKLGRKVC